MRWNTTSSPACLAIIGIDWMPDEPVPIDADALAGEVDALVRPAAREVRLAGEAIGALDVELLGHRQAARGHHVGDGRRSRRRRSVVTVHRDAPSSQRRRSDTRREADVLAQVVLVGDVLQVAQDLRLRGVLLRPRPLRLQLGVEASTCSRSSGCRSGRRGSGSSTTCRRRRRPTRARRRTARAGAAGTAGAGRRTRHRRRRRRRSRWIPLATPSRADAPSLAAAAIRSPRRS